MSCFVTGGSGVSDGTKDVSLRHIQEVRNPAPHARPESRTKPGSGLQGQAAVMTMGL